MNDVMISQSVHKQPFYNLLPTKMRERITSMATVPWWELEEVWPSVLPRVPFLD